MKVVKCACCGGSMKRNGKTSSGAQRWRCAACGASVFLIAFIFRKSRDKSFGFHDDCFAS